MIRKLLIANRGEIAVRILRTAKRMGISTVAVYSDVDRHSPHRSLADEAYLLPGESLSETYLNIGLLLQIATRSGCDALHPGYGFLSENPMLVKACGEAGITFVGPSAKVMDLMGNKISARNFAASIGVPVSTGVSGTMDEILKQAQSVGFPLLVKAAGGGGGKGMRIVHSADELVEALNSASREARNYFANETVYVEKFFENPRHIEVQILGDNFGNVVHLFERECSIQRRYQKIIEEAPSPTVNPELRRRMTDAAIAIGKAVKYAGAGTIEFLVDEHLNFYFLEMNTRIQVEHAVTELITGIDIVEQQLLVASGEPLLLSQDTISCKGHAIECRIYAEDPASNFAPSPGNITLYLVPNSEHIRIDHAMAEPYEVSSFFDPMIAKLITMGDNRQEARSRMLSALSQYIIHGIKTNINYLFLLIQQNDFINNTISTNFCNTHTTHIIRGATAAINKIPDMLPQLAAILYPVQAHNHSDVWNIIGYWRVLMQPSFENDSNLSPFTLLSVNKNKVLLKSGDQDYSVGYQIDVNNHTINLTLDDKTWLFHVSHQYNHITWLSCETTIYTLRHGNRLPQRDECKPDAQLTHTGNGSITAQMPGRVTKIAVKTGDTVQKGDTLIVIESMKMENNILSPSGAVVGEIFVNTGDLVNTTMPLLHLDTQ